MAAKCYNSLDTNFNQEPSERRMINPRNRFPWYPLFCEYFLLWAFLISDAVILDKWNKTIDVQFLKQLMKTIFR